MAREIGDGEQEIADFARDCGGVFAIERGFDFGRLFADFVEHQPRIVPIEADGRGLALQFHRAGQAGQGDRHIGEQTGLSCGRLRGFFLAP